MSDNIVAKTSYDNDVPDNMFWKASDYSTSMDNQYNRINKVREVGTDGSIKDSYLGLKTNVYPKAIYEFYTEMNLQTQGILELGASLVYDMYKNWAKLKDASPEEYEKMIAKGDGHRWNNHNLTKIEEERPFGYTSFYEFVDFLSLITKLNGNFDLNLIINSKNYILKVTEYRNTLNNGSKTTWDDDKLISLDIENSFLDMLNIGGNFFHWYDGIKYKIQPILIGVSKNVINSGNDGTYPLTKYNVLVDIDSVCRYIILSMKEYNEDTFVNERSFIETVVKDFGPHTCDQLSKNVALTLLSNRHMVQNGWNQFINKFNDTYLKLCDSSSVKNIMYKMKESINGMRFDYANIFDGTTESNNMLIETSLSMGDPSTFINNMSSNIDRNNGVDNMDAMISLIRSLFSRAFTAFYEFTYVLIRDGHRNLTITKSELGELEMINELSNIINSLDDYDCKSFFTDCVLRFKDTIRLYNDDKYADKVIKHLSISKKDFWIEVTNMFNILSNCMVKIANMEKTPATHKLSMSVARKTTSILNLIISSSGTLTSFLEYKPNKFPNKSYVANYIDPIRAVTGDVGYDGRHDSGKYVRGFLYDSVSKLEGLKDDSSNRTILGVKAMRPQWDEYTPPHIGSFNEYDLWNGVFEKLDMDDWDDLKDFPRYDVKGVTRRIFDSIYLRFGINSYEGNILELDDDDSD